MEMGYWGDDEHLQLCRNLQTFSFDSDSGVLSLKTAAVCTSGIPRPAGENAGRRDDTGVGAIFETLELSHGRDSASGGRFDGLVLSVGLLIWG